MSPGRTLIGIGAHCAVSSATLRRESGRPANSGKRPRGQSNLCLEPPEDDRTGDGIVVRNERGVKPLARMRSGRGSSNSVPSPTLRLQTAPHFSCNEK